MKYTYYTYAQYFSCSMLTVLRRKNLEQKSRLYELHKEYTKKLYLFDRIVNI